MCIEFYKDSYGASKIFEFVKSSALGKFSYLELNSILLRLQGERQPFRSRIRFKFWKAFLDIKTSLVES